jgi:hypothetical protein
VRTGLHARGECTADFARGVRAQCILIPRGLLLPYADQTPLPDKKDSQVKRTYMANPSDDQRGDEPRAAIYNTNAPANAATAGSASASPLMRRPRQIQRFTYWEFHAVNPRAHEWFRPQSSDHLSKPAKAAREVFLAEGVAHKVLTATYERLHRGGDKKAIFEYVSRDTWAYRSQWVTDQIELWRDQDEFEKLHNLMRAYTSSRGKTSWRALHKHILDDQLAFRRILKTVEALTASGWPSTEYELREQSFSNVAEEFSGEGVGGKGVDSLRLIYDHYSPLYFSIVPGMLTCEEFFAELEVMASRLKP